MRTVVLSDVHEDTDYLKKAEAVPGDAYVCLGDYFDSWNGVTPATGQTIRWLNEKATDERWTLLRGNHDVHYEFPDWKYVRCSGFSAIRRVIVGADLLPTVWDRMKWYAIVDGWILSHAGLHPKIVPPGIILSGMNIPEYLRAEAEAATVACRRQQAHPWVEAGWMRGGRHPVGGLLWTDWTELTPIRGCKQLVGHTEGPAVRYRSTPDKTGRNVCIDTCRRHVAIIENGVLECIEV